MLPPAWKSGLWHNGASMITINPCLTSFNVQFLSTRGTYCSWSSKANPRPKKAEQSDAFYVLRKGDIIGIYKSLSGCQAQVSSSVCGPSVGVYKGYSFCKDTKDHLTSHGFKDALYSMHAAHLKDDMFGTLVPCRFQEPYGLAFMVGKEGKRFSPRKRANETGEAASGDMLASPLTKFPLMTSAVEEKPTSNKSMVCILEFDGASKGNPGKAGAGAVLRTEEGSVISHVREGLGIATNNVAEYRALILGLKYALMKGFTHIQVQGDSRLVYMQAQDLWKTKNQNVADLCKEVKGLKDRFLSFNIIHVKREFNAIADNLANLATTLPVGEVLEDSCSLR